MLNLLIQVFESVQSDRSGQTICHVHVTDADSELDQIDCSIESSHRDFLLHPISRAGGSSLQQRSRIYEIVSASPLDRETTARHRIRVRCQDGTSPSRLVGQNMVHVLVRDINDQAPRFTAVHYTGRVRENAANSMVKMLPTVGSSQTSLQTSTGAGMSTGGIGTAGMAGRNAGAKSLASTGTQLGIRAVDADAEENAVILYSLTLWPSPPDTQSVQAGGSHEATEQTQLVHTSEAVEQQSTRGGGKRQPGGAGDVDKFYIEPETGQLRTRVPLDFEEQEIYQFLVVATDQAKDPEKRLNATARVTVEVECGKMPLFLLNLSIISFEHS
ncbi:unnamed protein product [Protopolystoma xenopodis]|uniref:Cadherin domain-containing protein n=1 Tax=Protopolystoma xenopodis TaxID=117903 RepID=A0A3S5CKG9_9PLAT|nr:unnamed protein product [Protopolystoma xenopodis]